MSIRSLIVAATAAVALSPAALAQAPDDFGDVGLRVENGRITTNRLEPVPDPATAAFFPSRVFTGEFFDQGGVIFSDEPGFFSQDGTFTPGVRFFPNITRALRVFAGGNFDTIPAERLEIGFGPDVRLTPLFDSVVPGFGIEVGPTGGFDDHLDQSLLGLGGPPATGVYLLALTLSTDNPLVGVSDEFFIVLNNGAPAADFDAAVDYANNVLVPAPGAAAAFAALGLAAPRRRRCRR
jgi:hypothetical protein